MTKPRTRKGRDLLTGLRQMVRDTKADYTKRLEAAELLARIEGFIETTAKRRAVNPTPAPEPVEAPSEPPSEPSDVAKALLEKLNPPTE